jgi:hypothetical protein
MTLEGKERRRGGEAGSGLGGGRVGRSEEIRLAAAPDYPSPWSPEHASYLSMIVLKMIIWRKACHKLAFEMVLRWNVSWEVNWSMFDEQPSLVEKRGFRPDL